ncbi:hypothetical protein BC937DRAFT_94551 [Endogone sp. FLAS-F59071]|nr:hypothetical protein BC937DRAFT_94551 [Endogone sp. FLAS-F59071]|eukprot:RUS13953.1 hypothetical protein BC937DRAFT_94551 [Endogone sp. FLAS-F59071]
MNRATTDTDIDLDRDPVTIELLELNQRLDQRQAEMNQRILACKNSYRTLALYFSFLGLEENLLQNILDHYAFLRGTVAFPVTPTPKSIQPFVWNNSKEDAQTSCYLQWLNDHVTLSEDVQVYHNSSLPLTTSSVSKLSTLRGTFNVAFVNKACVLDANVRAGIRVVMKLKKKVVDADSVQAIAELLAENILSQHPVVTVLTDLRDIWRFFWLAKGLVVSCVFSELPKAISLLETIIHEAGSTAPDTMPIRNAPYRERCNFKDAIVRKGEDGYALPQDVAVNMLELILQRSSVNIAGMLPQSEVADMRDALDIMEPKEIQSQIEQLSHLVAQININ